MPTESAKTPNDPRTYTLEVAQDGRAWRWIGITREQISEVVRTASGDAAFELHAWVGHDLRLFNLSPEVAISVLGEAPIVRPLELKDSHDLARLRDAYPRDPIEHEREALSDVGEDPSSN